MLKFSFLMLSGLLVMGCSDDDGTKTTCTPKTCAGAQKDCGSMPDGCGNVLECGTCTSPATCGGGGSANVCGQGSCTPTTCGLAKKNCGGISDGCSKVLPCGNCVAPQTCGGGGVENVCGTAAVKIDLGGITVDASSSVCDPTCMAQSGAVCCTKCGCDGTVKCMPVCPDSTWDCEMERCYTPK